MDPYPDDLLAPDERVSSPETHFGQRESIELAFIAALQYLPPRQRAVLLLRDVLAFDHSEIAAALDATPDSLCSVLQRARRSLKQHLPERTQQATLRSIADARLRGLVERYLLAWNDGDVPAIAGLLAPDASFSMPPTANWYQGRAAIAAFLAMGPASRPGRWRRVPAPANSQIAFGVYGPRDGRSARRPHAIELLTFDHEGQITAVTAFHKPETFALFGLPLKLHDPFPRSAP